MPGRDGRAGVFAWRSRVLRGLCPANESLESEQDNKSIFLAAPGFTLKAQAQWLDRRADLTERNAPYGKQPWENSQTSWCNCLSFRRKQFRHLLGWSKARAFVVTSNPSLIYLTQPQVSAVWSNIRQHHGALHQSLGSSEGKGGHHTHHSHVVPWLRRNGDKMSWEWEGVRTCQWWP